MEGCARNFFWRYQYPTPRATDRTNIMNTKLKNWLLAFVVSLFFYFSSQAQKFGFSRGGKINNLSVRLEFNDSIPENVQAQLNGHLDAFIKKYNSKGHAFRLSEYNGKDSSNITIYIHSMKFVTPGQQVLGVALTSIGLIGIPVFLVSVEAPIIFFFWVIPHNASSSLVSLSPDISQGPSKAYRYAFRSGGYFGNKEKQTQKHLLKFEKQLKTFFMIVERSYKTSSRLKPLKKK